MAVKPQADHGVIQVRHEEIEGLCCQLKWYKSLLIKETDVKIKLTNLVFNICTRFETVISFINSLFIHANRLSKILEITSHILWFFAGFKVIVQFNPIWFTSYFLRNPLFKTILVNIARRGLTGFLRCIFLHNPYCLYKNARIY